MVEDLPGEEWLGLLRAKGYEASSFGRLRSHWKRGGFGLREESVLIRPGVSTNGYLVCKIRVGGKPKSRTIHSLVAEAFKGLRPEGKECRHLDGVRINCVASNLEWGTNKENSDDKDRHGTKRTKFTRDDVLKIRELFVSGVRQAELARRFGVTDRAIHCVVTRVTWAHVA